MSTVEARASAQIIGGSVDGRPSTGRRPISPAIARTARKSSFDAAGNPASIALTPRRASARATPSFSVGVMAAPGDCSPSRSVVSKMRTCMGGMGDTGTSSFNRRERS